MISRGKIVFLFIALPWALLVLGVAMLQFNPVYLVAFLLPVVFVASILVGHVWKMFR